NALDTTLPLHSFPTRRSSDLEPVSTKERHATSSRGADGPTLETRARSDKPDNAGDWRDHRHRHFCADGNSRGAERGACSDSIIRSEEHTSELQSLRHLVCRLL